LGANGKSLVRYDETDLKESKTGKENIQKHNIVLYEFNQFQCNLALSPKSLERTIEFGVAVNRQLWKMSAQ